MDAIVQLHELNRTEARKVPADAPRGFVSNPFETKFLYQLWMRYVSTGCGFRSLAIDGTVATIVSRRNGRDHCQNRTVRKDITEHYHQECEYGG